MHKVSNKNAWRRDFFDLPAYQPLSSLLDFFSSFVDWPTINDYNRWLQYLKLNLGNSLGRPINFIDEKSITKTSSWHYERYIKATGGVPTRENNWHDFFNALCWAAFPETKAALNFWQNYYDQKTAQRTLQQNALTHFDECGMVILADDMFWLDLIRDFSWQELFIKYRDVLGHHVKFLIFGHATCELNLQAYIGLTAKALLFTVNPGVLTQDYLSILKATDSLCANYFNDHHESLQPKLFSPIPILGIPGWDKRNSDLSFYDNIKYFRLGRKTEL